MKMKFEAEKPWHKTTALLAPIVDAAVKADRDSQKPREYLGASMMGDPCLRKVAYQYHQTPKDADRGFSGQLYRVFDMGHDGEDRVVEYLRLAGFDLRTHKFDGGQFGYCVADGKMRGHIDGVIVGGRTIPGIGFPYPCLWENKALGASSWADVVRNGIKDSKPLYYAQVQIYMAYMSLAWCLFTCLNRDTGEIHYEVIEFDAAHAQEISDRGVRVIQSASPEEFGRIARERTDFRCKRCDFFQTCWAEKPVANATPAPAWLTKGDVA